MSSIGTYYVIIVRKKVEQFKDDLKTIRTTYVYGIRYGIRYSEYFRESISEYLFNIMYAILINNLNNMVIQ